ncbi:MAG: hypothetical protein ACI92S_005554, partial [Planctomycetaceae bacterium]
MRTGLPSAVSGTIFASIPNESVMPFQPRFHEGHLAVSPKLSRAAAVVRAGTSMLDVALMMEQCDFQ